MARGESQNVLREEKHDDGQPSLRGVRRAWGVGAACWGMLHTAAHIAATAPQKQRCGSTRSVSSACALRHAAQRAHVSRATERVNPRLSSPPMRPHKACRGLIATHRALRGCDQGSTARRVVPQDRVCACRARVCEERKKNPSASGIRGPWRPASPSQAAYGYQTSPSCAARGRQVPLRARGGKSPDTTTPTHSMQENARSP